MAGQLTGKLAFVTGAGSGIGRAACQVLAREGAKIIAADKNLESAQETVKSLPENGHNLSVKIEVNSSESVQNALQEVLKQYKTAPNVIVNSAGILRDNFLLKLSEQDFDDVIAVNLKGTFLVTQAFANAIVTQGIKDASIINISSIVGKTGNIGQANYSASKAGVTLLTTTACKEFGKFGIRCNTILPGFIKTSMTDTVPEKVMSKFLGMIPLGRMGQATEVAEVIAFLASDKSSYVSGASIEITGGF